MNITNIIATLTVVILASCGGNELEKKKAELAEVKAEQSKIEKSIKELEIAIANLDTSKAKIENGTTVETIELENKNFEHSIKVHGVVESSKNILINPEVNGVILSINVVEGQKIVKGQTIATIDASILRNSIAEVQKGLDFAITIFNKQKALNDKGVGTEMQFLEAKNRKESAEKSLQTLNSQLSKYTVKAQIGGYIDEIIPNEGEMASPQMPIMRLISLEKVFVTTDVSEALIGKVKEGNDVDVNFKNLKISVKGKIVQIGQYINPENRTFKVKIDLNEQNILLKPNLLAVVKIDDYKVNDAVVVPTTIIQDDMKGNFVFVVENNNAIKKYITLGMSNDTDTEILSGLEGNETIIIKGHKGLVEGEKLSIQE